MAWRIFSSTFLILLSLDLFVLGMIVQSVSVSLAGSTLLSGVSYFAIRGIKRQLKSKTKTALAWAIGPGVEVSNPNRPKKVSVSLQQKTLDLGFLGIGAPGSGKTVSIGVGYIQYLVNHYPDRGWAIIDGKGDIDYYQNLVKAGAKPKYFLSSELPGTNTINLFSGEALDVVDRCTRVLIPTTTTTTFYSDEQKTALITLVPLLKHIGVATNLRDLYAVLTIEEAGQELLTLAKTAPGVAETELEMAKKWYGIPFEERFTLNKGLINRLHIFCAGTHTDRFNAYQPDIDINTSMQAGESIFFHLPYSEFSKDIAVAIVEMFGVQARNRQLAGPDNFTPYPLLFEDYGGFFHENFGPISSRCRSAKMTLSFTFQSLAHLQKVHQTFMDELDDNLPTKIIFRVMGRNTVNFAIDLLGEYHGRELSASEMSGRAGTQMRTIKQERLVPRQLRELAAGEAFVSTLLYHNDTVSNPLYRVRFPDLRLDQSIPAALPGAMPFNEGQGLSLWSKYMSPSRLREIKARLAQELIQQAEAAL